MISKRLYRPRLSSFISQELTSFWDHCGLSSPSSASRHQFNWPGLQCSRPWMSGVFRFQQEMTPYAASVHRRDRQSSSYSHQGQKNSKQMCALFSYQHWQIHLELEYCWQKQIFVGLNEASSIKEDPDLHLMDLNGKSDSNKLLNIIQQIFQRKLKNRFHNFMSFLEISERS